MSPSHVRRKAMDGAALALEPAFDLFPSPQGGGDSPPIGQSGENVISTGAVASQSTSQCEDLDAEAREFSKEFGSSGWIRTSNPPVNRLTQVGYVLILRGFSSMTIAVGARYSGTYCSRIDHSGPPVGFRATGRLCDLQGTATGGLARRPPDLLKAGHQASRSDGHHPTAEGCEAAEENASARFIGRGRALYTAPFGAVPPRERHGRRRLRACAARGPQALHRP